MFGVKIDPIIFHLWLPHTRTFQNQFHPEPVQGSSEKLQRDASRTD